MDWIWPVELYDLACGSQSDAVHHVQYVEIVWHAGWTQCHRQCTGDQSGVRILWGVWACETGLVCWLV